MKTIYCFEYTFVQDQMGKPQKLEYKTYIIVEADSFGAEIMDKNGDYIAYNSKNAAISKFTKKYPHVDMTTVYVSEFKGDFIDSFEPIS